MHFKIWQGNCSHLTYVPDLYVEIVSRGNVSRVDYEHTIGSSKNNPQNAGIIVITKKKDKNAQKPSHISI